MPSKIRALALLLFLGSSSTPGGLRAQEVLVAPLPTSAPVLAPRALSITILLQGDPRWNRQDAWQIPADFVREMARGIRPEDRWRLARLESDPSQTPWRGRGGEALLEAQAAAFRRAWTRGLASEDLSPWLRWHHSSTRLDAPGALPLVFVLSTEAPRIDPGPKVSPKRDRTRGLKGYGFWYSLGGLETPLLQRETFEGVRLEETPEAPLLFPFRWNRREEGGPLPGSHWLRTLRTKSQVDAQLCQGGTCLWPSRIEWKLETGRVLEWAWFQLPAGWSQSPSWIESTPSSRRLEYMEASGLGWVRRASPWEDVQD